MWTKMMWWQKNKVSSFCIQTPTDEWWYHGANPVTLAMSQNERCDVVTGSHYFQFNLTFNVIHIASSKSQVSYLVITVQCSLWILSIPRTEMQSQRDTYTLLILHWYIYFPPSYSRESINSVKILNAYISNNIRRIPINLGAKLKPLISSFQK